TVTSSRVDLPGQEQQRLVHVLELIQRDLRQTLASREWNLNRFAQGDALLEVVPRQLLRLVQQATLDRRDRDARQPLQGVAAAWILLVDIHPRQGRPGVHLVSRLPLEKTHVSVRDAAG